MPHTQPAFDVLDRNIVSISERCAPISLLYVGWRRDCKPWWYDKFCHDLGVKKVGVLEIFPRNHAELEQQVWSGRYDVEPILGDVRSIRKHVEPGEYDVIFWDHGPEHVTRKELIDTTTDLCLMAKRLVIYCCPWGEWPQGAEDGNDHEVHEHAVYPEQLQELGMTVITTGSPDQIGEGELIAFHFVE